RRRAPTSPPFPYTTLFRSAARHDFENEDQRQRDEDDHHRPDNLGGGQAHLHEEWYVHKFIGGDCSGRGLSRVISLRRPILLAIRSEERRVGKVGRYSLLLR